MSRKAKVKRKLKSKERIKQNVKRKVKPKSPRRATRKSRPAKPSPSRRGKAAVVRKQPQRARKRPPKNPLLESAVREMNRGTSLTAAARSHETPPKTLKAYLRQHRISKRKGNRVTTRDNRLRRVPVMTNGKFRILTVRGYEEARLVGEHHYAAAEFVRTNNTKLIEPFDGETVQAINGREYPLETDLNALHRIAAMDTPPFHELYEITSST